MTEQAQGAAALSAVVADAASEIALALRGEGDPYALSRTLRQEDALSPAAVRVLGADALAPYALDGHPGADGAGNADAAMVREALTAFPPADGASAVSVWSYRGLMEASRAFLPAHAAHLPNPPEPGDDWLTSDPWPRLSHRVSQLASLALPGLAPVLTERLTGRTEDLARGFVRAVRRRDWQQSAGLGRWLARLPQTPPTLGLDDGLRFVRQMSDDPRVTVHVTAAQIFFGRAR
ncbi:MULTISPECIES: hypothetical protein [unclassified Streptomyces]|uniref:hypothetical protein n=1 Tax=unclassified Streptomyces TaxID=2593676 RepID=UPI002DDB4E7B|nr:MULTISPECIES: hypothetical protein [unclassified Streptomyces]WSA92202.1 hypothetical protein OIE63_11945 [Streptomyces sp. NBC_01795]WSB76569.1 hypothetical protein OHB04_12740 [Streptomyces sp. NBC_01775]WSS15144.1 hypothetical protein OG533_27115 [Streptomyces sp. NBC_01186]WSS43987.1 hypothetical protein OG220_27930 [Streptomyces sp. NBC_01187]